MVMKIPESGCSCSTGEVGLSMNIVIDSVSTSNLDVLTVKSHVLKINAFIISSGNSNNKSSSNRRKKKKKWGVGGGWNRKPVRKKLLKILKDSRLVMRFHKTDRNKEGNRICKVKPFLNSCTCTIRQITNKSFVNLGSCG